jgi:formate hydrogenlyase subunit 6/NADH:ubiquinone oxidoreductase subunit I
MMTYFKEIASGFFSLLGGMAVTIRYFVKPVVTVQYPRQKIPMSPNYRGYPQLIIDPDSKTHRCIACEMCSRICPSQLIHVEGAKFPGEKQKRATKYVHEHYYCSLCGLCTEVCPTTALEYSKEYRLCGFTREDAVIDHLVQLQQRQKALGLPATPVPTATEIAAAAEAEAKEKEAKAKAAAAAKKAEGAAGAEKPAAKPKAAPPEEVKE